MPREVERIDEQFILVIKVVSLYCTRDALEKAIKKLKPSTPAGFEPALPKGNRFLICRRNHLAIAPCCGPSLDEYINGTTSWHDRVRHEACWFYRFIRIHPHSTRNGKRSRIRSIGSPINSTRRKSKLDLFGGFPINAGTRRTRKTKLDQLDLLAGFPITSATNLLAHHCRRIDRLVPFIVDVAMDFTPHKHEVRS